MQHRAATYPTFDPTWYGPITLVMAGLETATSCMCASIPIFWGPLVTSASQFLGQIFVTKEVHVTTEHRFDHFGSNETFHQVEMQGPGIGYEEDTVYFGQRSGSRLEWVNKDGTQHYTETWPRHGGDGKMWDGAGV